MVPIWEGMPWEDGHCMYMCVGRALHVVLILTKIILEVILPRENDSIDMIT